MAENTVAVNQYLESSGNILAEIIGAAYALGRSSAAVPEEKAPWYWSSGAIAANPAAAHALWRRVTDLKAETLTGQLEVSHLFWNACQNKEVRSEITDHLCAIGIFQEHLAHIVADTDEAADLLRNAAPQISDM